jgi:tetratricopeptide (TPR) repeat protein
MEAVMKFRITAVAAAMFAWAAWSPVLAQGSVEDVMERGRKFFAGGENDKAIAEYTAAEESKQATEADKELALFNRGVIYAQNKEHAKAIADFTEALKHGGNQKYVIYNWRGISYADLGEYVNAIADYTEALKIDPKSVVCLNNRGLAYINIGENAKAIADFTAALAISPNDADYLYQRARAYGAVEDYAKAVADLEAARKTKPMAEADNLLALVKAALHHQKALTFAVKEDFDNAIMEINEAIRLQPNEVGYLWNRGVFYAEKGDYDRAKADIEAVLRAKPNYPGAAEMLARINEEESEEVVEESGDGLPASGRVQAGQQVGPRTGRGVGVAGSPRGGVGVAGSRRGGERRASALKFYNRGLNAYSARDYDRAVASFTEAIRINSRDASYYDSRASAYARKRDYDRAVSDYAEAIRLSPRRADFYVNRGDAYLDRGTHNRAVTDYSEAIRLDPKNADYYCNRGDAYMEMKDYRRAADDFESALRLDPRHPQAQGLLRQAKSQGRGYNASRGHNRGRRW